jgi:nucleoside-diphosphate-sugar epimerase
MSGIIAILGANGVYGRHLIPRLASAGYRVRALVRRPEVAGFARACGAEVAIADIFDADSLRQGLAGAELCINLATALPGPSGRGDYAVNDRVRREGVPRLIDACREAGVGRLLQQSIAMVGASDAAIAGEDAVYRPDGDDPAAQAIRATQDMEAAVRDSGLDWLILRGGLFYGPGTGFDDDWLARAAAGKLRLSGDGSGYVSLVHIADMAAATLAAVRVWPSRCALIVCDDRPIPWRDLFAHIAASAGAPEPAPGGRAGFPSFRMSNAKAKQVLGWSPFYADFRTGLAR